jgi:hypothetical protein
MLSGLHIHLVEGCGCSWWRTHLACCGSLTQMKTLIGVLLTSSRHVSGLYEIGNARLSDALNNPLESVVRLTNARLGRLGNPGANEPRALAVVPKAQIALVYVELEATRPADRRMAVHVPKQTTEILVLVAGLRVRGRAHASGPLDPTELHLLAAQPGDRFVVLTDAGLALDVEGTTERDIGVAMLNARHIQFVAATRVEGASERQPTAHSI